MLTYLFSLLQKKISSLFLLQIHAFIFIMKKDRDIFIELFLIEYLLILFNYKSGGALKFYNLMLKNYFFKCQLPPLLQAQQYIT